MPERSLLEKLNSDFLNSMDCVPHAIGILDLNGYLVFINRYFEKTYDVSRENIEGCHISCFYRCESEKNRILDYIDRILKGLVKPERYSDRADYPDNSKYQEIQWDYLKLNGKVEGIIYTSTNNQTREIYERQIDESKVTLNLQTEILENLKKKMKMALEAVNEGIWEWDLVRDEVQYDDRYFEMLGYTREQLAHLDNIWRFLVHPEDIDEYNRQFEEFVARKADKYEFRYRYKNASGEWLWILDKGQVVSRDETGMPTRIIGIHVDISEIMKKNEALEAARKHSEHLNTIILRANKDLKATQKLLEYVLKNARVGIWRWHFKEKTSYYDDVSQGIFGFNPSYPNGTVKLFPKIHPEDRRYVMSVMRDYKAGIIPEYDIRYRVIRPDSRIVWIQENGEIVEYDKDGNLELFIGSIRDITPQREFEELLIKARDDAQKANNLKTDLIANVNHELRTPLTVIIGLAETLVDIEADSQKKHFLNKILASSQRLLRLIGEVLHLSNIENGHLTVRKSKFDVHDYLRDYFIAIKSQAEKKSLDAFLDIDTSVEKDVYMDPNKLRLLLNNLFSNALKFTEEGEIGLIVTMDPEKIYFEVYDTGIGIPKEKRARIFDRFYQIDASSIRNYGGTGLGLAIVKELSEKMGGDILVEDYEKGGTRFIISLPYQERKRASL